jgi:DNA-directed RNA polymerase subunit RPC12/RpoP
MITRIAYCKKCKAEYEDVLNKYGEKCECGADLFLAERVKTKEYSCIKIWDLNNITRGITK